MSEITDNESSAMNRYGKHLDLSKTIVVSVISNPMRYASRYRLYKIFEEDILRKGAHLITVELQTGARVHKVTDKNNPDNFQLWHTGLDGVVWTKEGLQNYAVRQATVNYPDWRNVIFADADIRVEKDFISETVHSLQLHPVVQPWSHAVDFGPDGGATSDKMQLSFAYCHWNGIEVKGASQYAAGGHPGWLLAMRREAYNQLGGLVDIGICGSGDRHMLCAIIGEVHKSFHQDVSDGYKRWLFLWQERALKYVKKNLGYVPHILRHSFHGAKKNRFYGDRWKILTKWKFDPYTDLKLDANGMYQLVVEDERQINLRDALYKYFKSRQEDSNSL